ncbi:MAG: universal stress protein [Salegentibacter sp.]|uniref:Universal stress protein n=1 Tax=Salegentibacter flavus TaxID=287099 RepID=A0A1I4Z8J5_9FLAO|nr:MULTISPECIES: universal stress protein [Salegentibacter]MDR9456261.1 universal stress protein [Salegentibacter sp.]SFN46343.1 Nucleotide-binding universal stress protein, UspA family [Salegentibacter flavus]
MKKVLIALDYHPVSEEVVNAGYELAKKMGAEVCLVHVLSDVAYYGIQYQPFMGYEGYSETAIDLNVASEMRQVAEDYLDKAAEHLNDEKVGKHLAEGDTARTLLDYADEWQADLIVMGTHSHSFLEKLIMGTVAAQVLEKTKIPVYMVPVKK